jgi:hypothetical protein
MQTKSDFRWPVFVCLLALATAVFISANSQPRGAIAFAPPPAGASSRVQSVDGGIAPQGYQQLTNVSAATALTVPQGSNVAMIQAESQQVRWRDDGTNPAAGVGRFIPAGSGIWYTGDLTKLKFIEDAASAKVDVVYYYSG